MPRYVKIVDEFPMTVTGKIRKVEMRTVSVEELGLQGAAAVRTPERPSTRRRPLQGRKWS